MCKYRGHYSLQHIPFTSSNGKIIIYYKKRKILFYYIIFLGWVTLTFFGESVRFLVNKETNETLTEPVPRLPLKAWYPFDAMSGTMYIVAFVFQVSLGFDEWITLKYGLK